jgi:hypothetical protein
MKTGNVIHTTVGMTIIVLAGIAVVGDASLLLVQSVSATTDVITGTTVGEGGGGGGEAATISGNISTSTDSNVTLGNLFYSARTVEETFNPINETYFVISYVDSVTLMPPNATGVVINATDRGNLTTNILPNGLSISQGQGFLVTEEDGSQEESATSTFVSLGRSNPEGTTGSATGAIFFSTNSTGQLAFLNNIVGIAQLEFSPEGSTLKIWEWKGGTLAPILE